MMSQWPNAYSLQFCLAFALHYKKHKNNVIVYLDSLIAV